MKMGLIMIMLLSLLSSCVSLPTQYDQLEANVYAMNLDLRDLERMVASSATLSHADKAWLLQRLESIRVKSDLSVEMLISIRRELHNVLPQPVAEEITNILHHVLAKDMP